MHHTAPHPDPYPGPNHCAPPARRAPHPPTSLTPRPTLATRSGMSNMYGGMNGGMGGMMGMVRGTSQYQPRMNFGMSYR